MSSIPKDYHNFADVFSKSKANKLADHQPYNLKITLDEGIAPPFGHIYSLSWEKLVVLHKFIDKISLQGSYAHLTHPMEPWFFLSASKMAPFKFASTSGASTKFQRKTDTHSCSSLISSMHHEKHKSTPKLTSSMHITLSKQPLEMNGRLPSKPIMVHLSG